MEYFYKYDVIAKGRWLNKKLIDIFQSEYSNKSVEYYTSAINLGIITVNNNKVNIDYQIKSNDKIQHLVHIHEPNPISIKILKIEDELIIINKPSGIPYHPVSGYKNFTVTEIIKKQMNLNKVSCINRIDVPVSGIVILATKNPEKYHKLMMKGNIEKYYIALVEGFFEDTIVDRPLKRDRNLKSIICSDGKPSITIFKNLKYNSKYSLVECQPITGRSHQIRAHLAYLGFPIVGDVMYGYKNLNNPEVKYDRECNPENLHFEDYNEELLNFVIKNCNGKDNRAYKYKNYMIYLHAYKYKFLNKEYVTDIPEWIKLVDDN